MKKSRLDSDRKLAISSVQKSTLLCLGVIALTSAIMMLPIWWYGFPSNSHDTRPHASWQYFFSMQLWNGDFYPRWLVGHNEGLGSPSFYIYPPLSQYVAALFAPFSASTEWVYQRLGIAATLSFLISGIGAYFWLLKITQDRMGALLGALVFLLSPYHLLTDTYIRAAYAELWAFSWAPFSLWAIHLFKESPSKALLLYCGATSALLFSHAPSCIALLPAYVVYAAVLSFTYKEKQIFTWTLVATLIAVLIAGAYLATALTHQPYINNAALFTGQYDFNRWFLLSKKHWPSAGMGYAIPGTVFTQFFAVAFFGYLTLCKPTFDTIYRNLTWLSILASLVVLFMVSIFSKPIWDIIPLIKKIQFPWRLLVVQTVFLAMTCALYVRSVKSHINSSQRPLNSLLMTLFVLILFIVNVVLVSYTKPQFTHSSILRTRDAPEYHLGNIRSANALFGGSEKIKLIAGDGSIKLDILNPHYIRIHIDAKTEIEFIVRHFHYPGWSCATPSGTDNCKIFQFRPKLPVVAVWAGAGKRTIELRLTGTNEGSGYLLSMIGFILLISAVVWTRHRETLIYSLPAVSPFRLT